LFGPSFLKHPIDNQNLIMRFTVTAHFAAAAAVFHHCATAVPITSASRCKRIPISKTSKPIKKYHFSVTEPVDNRHGRVREDWVPSSRGQVRPND
jgi:hypothetical protein